MQIRFILDFKFTPDEQMVASRSLYSLRGMELANGVMAHGEIKMAGEKQGDQAC